MGFSENIEYRFYSYATKIEGKQKLLVATLKQIEVLEKSTRSKFLFINLPEKVVRAEVPVEYNFTVPLTHGWKFKLTENSIHVQCPELSNTAPSINLKDLKYSTMSNTFFQNSNNIHEELKTELHSYLIDRSIQLRENVREQAKKSISDFISKWLVSTYNIDPTSKEILIEFK